MTTAEQKAQYIADLENEFMRHVGTRLTKVIHVINQYTYNEFNERFAVTNFIKGVQNVYIEIFTEGLDKHSDYYEDDQHRHTMDITAYILDDFLKGRNLELESDMYLWLFDSVREDFIDIYDLKEHSDYYEE